MSWTCIECGVVASFATEPADRTPDGWTSDKRGWLCLGCRRDEVVAAVTATSDQPGRTAQRRALTEFELLRDPAASDGQIAQRIHTSPGVVRPVRAELREAGRLPAE